MAVGVVQVVHPKGGRIFKDSNDLFKVIYEITGDGVGGAVNLGYDLVDKVVFIRSDFALVPVDDPANRRVTLTVPAGLANTRKTYVEIIGVQ
ncbi:MAG TPA: hypothetical protein PKC13_24255 [Blastocatellia bacterium]|nr:hypothetical protein [Blastocatellia bacterium]HMX28721.1 hypothetical protein [Blastocatellia bacterium]HMY71187.1 hypothetical protein [Blastocatellia bacterium]